eukprot:7865887-Alexandrium_andersonii.AAC.1
MASIAHACAGGREVNRVRVCLCGSRGVHANARAFAPREHTYAHHAQQYVHESRPACKTCLPKYNKHGILSDGMDWAGAKQKDLEYCAEG